MTERSWVLDIKVCLRPADHIPMGFYMSQKYNSMFKTILC